MSRQYREARRRARKKIRFYKHLKVYVFVNIFLAIAKLSSGHFFGWFPAPFFWGIGLFFHYVSVFGLPGTGGLYSKDWEQKIIDEELDQFTTEEEEIEKLELRQRQKEHRKNWDDSDLV